MTARRRSDAPEQTGYAQGTCLQPRVAFLVSSEDETLSLGLACVVVVEGNLRVGCRFIDAGLITAVEDDARTACEFELLNPLRTGCFDHTPSTLDVDPEHLVLRRARN